MLIRLGTIVDARARFVDAVKRDLASEELKTMPVNFTAYDDMHRVFAPSRLPIVDGARWMGRVVDPRSGVTGRSRHAGRKIIDLAMKLDDDVLDLMESLEFVRDILHKLTELHPESLLD